MKQFVSKSLNIPRILTLGDLDVRGIAAANSGLAASEYFSMVEWFIEDAPQFAEALTSVSDMEKLVELKRVLTEIGYDMLNADIETMIDEINGGGMASAKKRGAEVLVYFNALYERLKSAYTPKRRGYARTIENRVQRGPETASESKPEDKQDSKTEDTAEETAKDTAEEAHVSLAEALEYLDYEEAHRKLRILAVDDIAVMLNTITSTLSPHYEVFALTKASQVEKFLAHTTPELFLLDIEMPDMHGYDLVSVIRSFKEHKDTPIIFLTGNATLDNIKTAVALGACDFITKPVNQDILLEKIESKIVWKKAF